MMFCFWNIHNVHTTDYVIYIIYSLRFVKEACMPTCTHTHTYTYTVMAIIAAMMISLSVRGGVRSGVLCGVPWPGGGVVGLRPGLVGHPPQPGHRAPASGVAAVTANRPLQARPGPGQGSGGGVGGGVAHYTAGPTHIVRGKRKRGLERLLLAGDALVLMSWFFSHLIEQKNRRCGSANPPRHPAPHTRDFVHTTRGCASATSGSIPITSCFSPTTLERPHPHHQGPRPYHSRL